MFETTGWKNLQPFILKLMGLVVVLPGWYRYSRGERGGGQSVTDYVI